MINNEVIINNFFTGKSKRLCRNYQDIINNDEEIKKYLDTIFVDSKSYKETLLRIKYNCIKRPICKICGKEVEFLGYQGHLYREYCSKECKCKSKEVVEHRKETCIERYGVDNYSKTEESKEKIKNTCIKKYNREYPYNHQKSSETKLKRYGDKNYVNPEKIKETFLTKYGESCALKIKQFKEKVIEKNISKYNVRYYFQSKECREKRKSEEAKQKEYNTKKKNHSFNMSKDEEESYILLKEKYPDIIRQYKSKEYPYLCDFYIPSKKLYIECNYHWTHGEMIFDSSNEICINKLNEWKNGNTKFYKNAIETWTIRDIKKRNTAKENNLNWIEFFNIEELKEWVNNN